MQWFSGSIQNAIQTAKTEKKHFIVVVHGPNDDEESRNFLEVLESADISSRLAASAISIRLENGSEACRQFAQIYPVILVPSIYFIDSATGVDQEVTGGTVTRAKLEASLAKVLGAASSSPTTAAAAAASDSAGARAAAAAAAAGAEVTATEHSGQAAPEQQGFDSDSGASPRASRVQNACRLLKDAAPTPCASPATSSSSSANGPTAAAAAAAGMGVEGSDDASAVPQEAAARASAASEASRAAASTTAEQLSLAERVERAKNLLAERQAQKAQEGVEKEKSAELERRETGKKLADLKEQQENDRRIREAKERRKERDDERLARERIKATIAQDRAEKAARFDAEKDARIEEQRQREEKGAKEKAAEAEAKASARSSVARLQFRLPDGRTQTRAFPAAAPLADVYAFVREGIDAGFNSFSLSTTFPTRQLDAEDPASSLGDIGLAPSSTVLILPSTNGGTSLSPSADGSLLAWMWLLLTPVTVLCNVVVAFFTGATTTAAAQPAATPEARRRAQEQQRRPDRRKRSAETEEPGSNREAAAADGRRRGTGKKKSSGVRTEGNIGRISNDNDEDDENNTWNGNSTQQM